MAIVRNPYGKGVRDALVARGKFDSRGIASLPALAGSARHCSCVTRMSENPSRLTGCVAPCMGPPSRGRVPRDAKPPLRLAGRVAPCMGPPSRGRVPRDAKPPLNPPFGNGRSVRCRGCVWFAFVSGKRDQLQGIKPLHLSAELKSTRYCTIELKKIPLGRERRSRC